MKVKDVMTSGPRACTSDMTLAEAASVMWDNDCGILPVVDEWGRVISMITDRDICFGAMSRNRAPSAIAVGEVISRKVFACRAEDDIHEALKTMRAEHVRRLPVLGNGGTLRGIVSMNDVVLRAEENTDGASPDLSYADVVQTYKAICAHSLVPQIAQPVPRIAAS